MTRLLLKKYLFSKNSESLIRTISWVCMIGVAISVAAMIVVLSVMEGLNHSIHQRLLSAEPHLVVLTTNHSADEISQLKNKLTQLPHESILAFTQQDVVFRTIDGLYSGAIAKGLSNYAEYIQSIEKNKGQIQTEENEVTLGADLALSLRIIEGDELTIIAPESLLQSKFEKPKLAKVKVIHILKTNVADIDSSHIFYPIAQSLGAFQDTASRETGLAIRTAENEIQNFEKIAHKNNFQTQNWRERNSSFLYALKMEKLMMSIFLSLTILIACFGIITSLALLITQKNKEIGVLMSLGMSSQRISNTFVKLGSSLSGIGIFSGAILGVLTCVIVDYFGLFKLPSDIYYDARVPIDINPMYLIYICFFSLSVSTLGAWLPCHFLLRWKPTLSLRAK